MAYPQLQQNMGQPQLQQCPQWNRIQEPVGVNVALKGKSARMASGIWLIVTGVAEIIIASILLIIRFVSWCGYLDVIAWGVWGGVFAVTTGFFGIFSGRSKCMVIAFLVLGIIDAVISGMITIVYGFQTACGVHYEPDQYFDITQFRIEVALYILMCIICAFQMLMSIIGASFTCTAICSSSDPLAQHLITTSTSEIPRQSAVAPGSYGAVICSTSDVIQNHSKGMSDA